jgi:hypothetical protein
MTADIQQQIIDKIKTNPFAGNLFNALKANADIIVTQEPKERIQIGRRLLQVSREVLRRVTCLSIVYLITNDKKYLERADQEMLVAASFTDWNPSHYLDVAEMSLGMALGYDWLYNDLSEESRAIIRQAIIDKGFNTYKPNTKSNNWNDVCNGGMIVAALAIAEHDPQQSAEIIFKAVSSLPIAMSNYSETGAHPEGILYWNYAACYSTTALAALECACDTNLGLIDAHPGYMNSMRFVMHLHGPTNRFVNYSDASSNTNKKFRIPAFWFAKKLHNSSFAAFNQDYLRDLKPDQRLDRFAALALAWMPESAEYTPPTELYYKADGITPIAAHRSSWDDPNASYITLKGGSPRAPHNHMDGGSFIFESDGVRWASDIGMQKYESLEKHGVNLWQSTQDGDRWKVFRLNCFSHNTLIVDNRLHDVKGFAPFVGTSEDHSILDLSSLFTDQLESAIRAVRILPDKRGVIQDEFVAMNASKVRWAMLTETEVSINESTAILTQNGKKLTVSVLEPTNAILHIFQSDPPPWELDTPNPGTQMIGFTIDAKPESLTRIVVMLTPGSVTDHTVPEILDFSEYHHKDKLPDK